jgi:hypothetical protein
MYSMHSGGFLAKSVFSRMLDLARFYGHTLDAQLEQASILMQDKPTSGRSDVQNIEQVLLHTLR